MTSHSSLVTPDTMIGIVARRLPTRSCWEATVRYQLWPARRTISSSARNDEPPLSSHLPADAYQLLPASEKAGSSEDKLFEQQLQAVKQWWASPRYEGIRRPYSAEDVVGKRGSLQQIYPSSLMARKLFNLFKERAAAGEPVHTSIPCVLNRDTEY